MLLASLLVAGAFVFGACGGGGETLSVGDIGWTENTAVSNLTKVLLEEELGYEEVTIRIVPLSRVFEDVENGDLEAFQDVWLPNHQAQIDEVQDDIVQLDPWYQGETEFGVAVPYYMDVTSIDQLNQTGAELIFGIEPESVIMEAIPEEVIPAYGLEQKLVESSTEGMLSEVDNRYNNGEEFAFIAWSPHWMNQVYDFRYLEDPQDALGELDESAEISSIVNEDLPDYDPVAYAFLSALTLTEEQVNDLEDTINTVGDPLEGARTWAQNNPNVIEPWIEAAQNARED